MTTLHGREVGFARTIWANIQLGKIAPGGDIVNFGKSLSEGSFVEQMETTIKLILILNQAHIKQCKFEDPNFSEEPITEEEIFVLTDEEFSALATAALGQFNEDAKTTVDAEPKKTNEVGAALA